MPLPDQHAARQIPPTRCEKFRRQNDAFGAGIDVIYCIRPGKPVEPQSIRFDASKFTPEEARAWLKKHDFSAADFEPASGSGKAAAAAAVEVEPSVVVDLNAEGLPLALRTLAAESELDLQAEAASPSGVRLRPFDMTAYTGVPMKLGNFSLPVVVDLQGLKIPTQRLAILRNHDPERIVGHSERVEVSAQRLRLGGLISGVTHAAKEVLDLAANAFPWQSSMGADIDRMEMVEKGKSATVNGRRWDGPLYVARGTTLGEVSFVARGADFHTSATVAAT